MRSMTSCALYSVFRGSIVLTEEASTLEGLNHLQRTRIQRLFVCIFRRNTEHKAQISDELLRVESGDHLLGSVLCLSEDAETRLSKLLSLLYRLSKVR